MFLTKQKIQIIRKKEITYINYIWGISNIEEISALFYGQDHPVLRAKQAPNSCMLQRGGIFHQLELILLCLPHTHHHHYYGHKLFQQELQETSIRTWGMKDEWTGKWQGRKRKGRSINVEEMGIWRARSGSGDRAVAVRPETLRDFHSLNQW